MWKYAVLSISMLFVTTQCDSPTQSPASVRVVTFDEYQRINLGMDLDEVQEIIGAEGKERSRDTSGPSGIVRRLASFSWIWTNADGSYVICNFNGSPDFWREERRFNSLTSKLQEGL